MSEQKVDYEYGMFWLGRCPRVSGAGESCPRRNTKRDLLEAH